MSEKRNDPVGANAERDNENRGWDSDEPALVLHPHSIARPRLLEGH